MEGNEMAIAVNQTNVANGNVTPGDTPGFPLTVSKPGSYVLTSNLKVPDGKNAIVIGASHVTIDLNGFSILGSSSASGPHSGLVSAQANCEHVTLRDGHMTGDGIELAGQNCRVEHIEVSGFNAGISVGQGGMICACVLRTDVGYMNAGDGSTVCENVVSGGDQNSIRVGNVSIVRHNTVSKGGATALWTGEACLVSGNALNGGGEGIRVGSGSTVTDNAVQGTNLAGISYMGSVVIRSNTIVSCSVGISATGVPGDGALVIGNSVTNCKNLGLDLSNNSGYTSNVLTGNNGGNSNSQLSGGVSIGNNLCGSVPCS
jgi:hypothetical protein